MLETVLSSTSDAGELVEHLLSKSIAGNYIISGKVECWKQLSLTIHFKSIQACSSYNVTTCKTSKHSLTFCVHVEHYLFSDNGISQVVQSWLHGFRLLWLITRWLSPRCVLVRCAHCRYRRTASVQTSCQSLKIHPPYDRGRDGGGSILRCRFSIIIIKKTIVRSSCLHIENPYTWETAFILKLGPGCYFNRNDSLVPTRLFR